jgi:hypothetical protein
VRDIEVEVKPPGAPLIVFPLTRYLLPHSPITLRLCEGFVSERHARIATSFSPYSIKCPTLSPTILIDFEAFSETR